MEGIITREQLHDAYEAAHKEAVLGFLNLENFMERSPLSVYPHSRLGRAYEVFQKMQLRHLAVTNKSGVVVGMLTRKDLQDYLIQKNASLAKIQAVMRGKLARIRTNAKLKSFRKQKTIEGGHAVEIHTETNASNTFEKTVSNWNTITENRGYRRLAKN